jgi:hypothetical protein
LKRFWWKSIHQDVSDWVKSCDICQTIKPRNTFPDGMLNPHAVPERLFEVVSMDFVTGLPLTKRGHDAVVTFTDKLGRMVHLVPLHFGDSSAQQVARIYFDHVWKYHGSPRKFISDRDPRFQDAFWQELQKLMGIKVAMTTPYNPQSDGQAENTNRTMEMLLRSFVEGKEHDWDLWLTPVQFAINDSRHAVTGFSPFELTNGWSPVSQLDLFVEAGLSAKGGGARDAFRQSSKARTAHDFAREWADNLQLARSLMVQAQVQMEDEFNKRHVNVEHAIGDLVWIDGAVVKPPGDSETQRKLKRKWHGPWPITKRFYSDQQMELPESDRGSPSSYQVTLPHKYRMHDVFTPARLRKRVSGHQQFVYREADPPPEPVLVAGHREYEVESILNDRVRGNVREWRVRWKGYPASHDQWLTEKYINQGGINRAWKQYEAALKRRAREVQRTRQAYQEEHSLLSILDAHCEDTMERRVETDSESWNLMEEEKIARVTCTIIGGEICWSLQPLPKRFLVLFSGTGSVENVLREIYPGCEIVSVDIDGKWGASDVSDVCLWNYKNYAPGHFDMIWASPPCTEYSAAKTVGVRDLKLADKRVRKTLSIIDYLEPKFWFIENPVGTNYGMHTRKVVKNLLRPYQATYCMYGNRNMKPTHIFSNVELPTELKRCTAKTPCEDRAQFGRHTQTSQSGPVTRADGSVVKGSGKGENVYPIPAPLLRELFENAPLQEAMVHCILEACVQDDSNPLTDHYRP